MLVSLRFNSVFWLGIVNGFPQKKLVSLLLALLQHSRGEDMTLEEARRILTLVTNDPDHGAQGAYEDQDVAAGVILAELTRLEQENLRLRTNGK